MTTSELLSRLDEVRVVSGGWMAPCPAHEDRKPSLSISERDGKTLLKCHAGCETPAIVEALGLKMADLFADAKGNGNGTGGRIVASYDYHDETGKLLFQVVREEPKGFKQRRPDGKDGWIWKLGDVRRVLYRLPEVIKADSVLIAEGEKDCDTAARLGLVTTCNPHGAGKWKSEYSESLRGKLVTVICDADAPGLAHGRDVARSLMGIAASVKLIEALPGNGVKDLADYIHAGGTRESLLSLISETPELKASDAAKWTQPKAASGFALATLGELMAKPDAPVEYVWEGRLIAGTVSAAVSKPKVGKSTLVRNLCLAIARGEDFLGLKTKQGECIYLALEEREEDLRSDFRAMGADGTEPILVHAAAAPADGIRALCELVKERKPRLVVIDPLFRLARIRDEKNYAETYAALGPLIDAARETGTHVMLLHHSGKSPKADAIDSPLGSTAIAGAVSSLIVLKRTDAYRVIQTVQRIGQDMPETVLQFDADTKRLSIGGTRLEADRRECESGIVEFLSAASEPQTQAQIRDGVEGQTKVIRAAITSLVEAGKVIKTGEGTKGKPFLYEFQNSGSQHIVGTSKPESEKVAQTRINIDRILVPGSEQNPILVPDAKEEPEPAFLIPQNGSDAMEF